jgi:NADH:ubiquinone oxidoreductase subunit 6 (subunit J)
MNFDLAIFATILIFISFMIVKIFVINPLNKNNHISNEEKNKIIKDIYKSYVYFYAFLLLCSIGR